GGRRRTGRSGRILPARLQLRHPARQLLGLLSQLGLFARQLLELTSHLGIVQALAFEILLAPEHLVLASRELGDLLKRLVVLLVLTSGRLAGLVFGFLEALQFLVEQRRDVVVAVVVAGTALRRLLPRHLALLDERLGFEQRVERLHLRRERRACFERV